MKILKQLILSLIPLFVLFIFSSTAHAGTFKCERWGRVDFASTPEYDPCVTTSTGCAPGEQAKLPDEKTCEDGNTRTASSCPVGEHQCFTSSCIPGSKSCSGNFLLTCNSSGSGTTSQNCTSSGQFCVPSGGGNAKCGTCEEACIANGGTDCASQCAPATNCQPRNFGDSCDAQRPVNCNVPRYTNGPIDRYCCPNDATCSALKPDAPCIEKTGASCPSSYSVECSGNLCCKTTSCTFVTAPTTAPIPDYNPCEGTGAKQEECEACVGNPPTGDKAWTAFGCFPTDPGPFAAEIIKILFGIAGGVAFLLILYGAFICITSGGDPQKAQACKETITSAIVGLLMLIFSLLIVRIVFGPSGIFPGFVINF